MREIAAEMGVSPAFVCRALKAHQRLPARAFGDLSASEGSMLSASNGRRDHRSENS
jgi:hypothetical protein